MILKPFKMDLHVHTALSPCAEKEMTPRKIIHAARAKGLKILAVTDHNTAENVAATITAARGSGILVIPGMEVQTREEVHIVCLFPTVEKCLSWQDIVYKSLPFQPNRPEVFGTQPVMDSTGQVIRELDRMLLISTELSVEAVVAQVSALGGICIPAHVDRPSYSLMTTLGFIPDGLNVQALEISRHTTFDEARITLPSLKDYTLISSSDAHNLKEVGANPSIIFCREPPDFKELQEALVATNVRKVLAKMKDLSMHIADILQNSIEAGADDLKLNITENSAEDLFTIELIDNGRGMDAELLAKVTDPFFTTRKTRRVGLGLPLLKVAAERCNGWLEINSAPGKGTSVKACFRNSHIDRAPLGNIVDTLINVVVSYPELNLHFNHKINQKEIDFDARQLRDQLEDVPLNNPAVINWIRTYLIDSYGEIKNNP